jgi:chromosome segregation ATPase
MDHYIGKNDAGDGYLSDVQTQHSQAPSELSRDLVASAKILESTFMDKYRILKSAYEKRITQLSNTIQDSCTQLLNDEIMKEMLLDPTSSAFIPIHITEMYANFLESDRESYIHLILEQLSSAMTKSKHCESSLQSQTERLVFLETELSNARKSDMLIEPVKDKLRHLEADFAAFTMKSQNEIDRLRAENESLEKAERKMKKTLESTQSKLEMLEKTNLDISKDHESSSDIIKQLEFNISEHVKLIEVYKTKESKEEEIKVGLKQDIEHLNRDHDRLLAELSGVKQKHALCTETLERQKNILRNKSLEEQTYSQRMATLMSEVETLLNRETSESNATISSLHEKMQVFRHRLGLELQREKRASTTLQEEVDSIRRNRDDKTKEIYKLETENTLLKEKLKSEEERVASMRDEIDSLAGQITDLKARYKETTWKLTLAEDNLQACERANDNLRRRQKEVDIERRDGDDVIRKLRDVSFQYHAAAHKQQSDGSSQMLPPAQEFPPNMKLSHASAEGGKTESIGFGVAAGRHNADSGADTEVAVLKRRLLESADHVARLRDMVLHGRTTIRQLEEDLAAKATQSQQSDDDLKYSSKLMNSDGTVYVGSHERAETDLRAENDRLQRLLEQCKEEALRDHRVDKAALEKMNEKFFSLMQKYQSTIANLSDVDESAEMEGALEFVHVDQMHAIEEKLKAANETVASLQSQLAEETSAKYEVAREAKRTCDGMKKIHRVLIGAISQLRSDLSDLRDDVLSSGTLFPSMVDSFVIRVSEVIDARAYLGAENASGQICRDEISRQDSRSVTASTESAVQASIAESMRQLLDALQQQQGSVPSAAATMQGHGSTFPNDANANANANAATEESLLFRRRLEINGNDISHPRSAVSPPLTVDIAGHSSSSQPNNFTMRRPETSPSHDHARDSFSRGDFSHYSSPYLRDRADSKDISSLDGRAIDMAIGVELEQSRVEHNLILKLAKLESESHIKDLINQIENLKHVHEIEVKALRSENETLEVSLQKLIAAQLK